MGHSDSIPHLLHRSFYLVCNPMGLSNMLSTVMNTAFALLTDTCLYIMAIAVIMGAVSALLTEFGVVAMLNHLLSPLMKPIYGLPVLPLSA